MDRQSQIRKLAECSADLSHITTDVSELQAELTRLRADGHELAQLVAERDVWLAQKRTELTSLEQERARWQEHAETASTALRGAEARLLAHDEQVATLEHELRTLRTLVEERERRRDDVGEGGPDRANSSRDVPNCGHVRLIALSGGYRLSVSDEPSPRQGDRVEVEGAWFVVARAGRSPLPGDGRPCALLMPEWT
jgi:predicted nuclease with TOPRIM domain